MNKSIFLTIVSVFIILSGCTNREKGSSVSDRQERGDDQPIVSFWDFGVQILGIKPAVVFAAWSDGTVVFRVDKSGIRKLTFHTPMEIRDCKLMAGSVRPSVINSLIETAKQAGALNPPIKDGIVFTDGPLQAISVRHKGQQQLLHYHGREDFHQDHLKRIGINSFPSRQDVEEYVRMWKTIINAIAALEPTRVSEFDNKRELTYPKAWWMIEAEKQIKQKKEADVPNKAMDSDKQ